MEHVLPIGRRRGPVRAGTSAGGERRGQKEEGCGSGCCSHRARPSAAPPGVMAGGEGTGRVRAPPGMPPGAVGELLPPVEAGLRPPRRQEPWPSSTLVQDGGAAVRRWGRGSGDPVEYREDAARSFKLGSMKLPESNNGKGRSRTKRKQRGAAL